IKNVFMAVVSFYAYIYGQAFEAIKTAFGVVVSWLSGVWDKIKVVFAVVGEWFGDIFGEAFTAIKTAFGGMKKWFGSLWEGIKGSFTGFINTIIDGINYLIDGLNSISFDVPDWVPGWAGGGETFGVSIPNIPHLAKGGIATEATLALIGEGKEDEAVLPLSKLQALLDAPRYPNGSPTPAAQTRNAAPSQTMIFNISVNVSGGDAGTAAAQNIGAVVKHQIQDILEGTGRILNAEVR
ncbi:phage-related protein, partial [Paenibacillus popilliae ATCC 14706]